MLAGCANGGVEGCPYASICGRISLFSADFKRWGQTFKYNSLIITNNQLL